VSDSDSISRAELTLALRSAANRQVDQPPDERIPMVQAERIAADVGISPAEFRSALWGVHERRNMQGGLLLGPDGVQVVHHRFGAEVPPSTAAHMLAQAQSAVPTLAKSIENPAEGVWRLQGGSKTAFQVATRSGETTVTVALDKRSTKAALLGVGTAAGAVVGSMAAGAVALSAMAPSVEALAIANVIGVIGGAASGYIAGRTLWSSVARRARRSLLAALSKMRNEAERLPSGNDELLAE
jgi:hypothetical protein